MTTPSRRPLDGVTEQDAPHDRQTDAACDGIDDWRAQTVVDQLAPEHQLIGALMHLSAPEAKLILEAVPNTAIWRPITRSVYVMYARTLFGCPARLAPDALFRPWRALAANPRSKSFGTSSLDIECVLDDVGWVVCASLAKPHAVIDKEVSR
jgi:hypothetical protein